MSAAAAPDFPTLTDESNLNGSRLQSLGQVSGDLAKIGFKNVAADIIASARRLLKAYTGSATVLVDELNAADSTLREKLATPRHASPQERFVTFRSPGPASRWHEG